MNYKRLFITLVVFVAILSYANETALADSQLTYAQVNGQTLSTSNPTITVSPGASLTGTINVDLKDPCSSCVLPSVGINSWNRNYFADLGGFSGDNQWHTKQFSFSFTAPSSSGTYYIALGYGGCYAAADVVYGCYGLGDPRRGQPGGGDDIWDTANWESMMPSNQPSGAWRAIKVIVGVTPPPTYSFMLTSISPNPVTLGSNIIITGTITPSPQNGVTTYVHYTRPNGSTLTTTPVHGQQDFSSGFTVDYYKPDQAGTWSVYAEAYASGQLIGTSNSMTFRVQGTGFSISTPIQTGIYQGSSGTVTVSVSSSSQQLYAVSLSLSGLPSGVSYSFSPQSGNPSFTSTLTLTVGSNAPTGDYKVTITGTGGGYTSSNSFTLTVYQTPSTPTPTVTPTITTPTPTITPIVTTPTPTIITPFPTVTVVTEEMGVASRVITLSSGKSYFFNGWIYYNKEPYLIVETFTPPNKHFFVVSKNGELIRDKDMYYKILRAFFSLSLSPNEIELSKSLSRDLTHFVGFIMQARAGLDVVNAVRDGGASLLGSIAATVATGGTTSGITAAQVTKEMALEAAKSFVIDPGTWKNRILFTAGHIYLSDAAKRFELSAASREKYLDALVNGAYPDANSLELISSEFSGAGIEMKIGFDFMGKAFPEADLFSELRSISENFAKGASFKLLPISEELIIRPGLLGIEYMGVPIDLSNKWKDVYMGTRNAALKDIDNDPLLQKYYNYVVNYPKNNIDMTSMKIPSPPTTLPYVLTTIDYPNDPDSDVIKETNLDYYRQAEQKEKQNPPPSHPKKTSVEILVDKTVELKETQTWDYKTTYRPIKVRVEGLETNFLGLMKNNYEITVYPLYDGVISPGLGFSQKSDGDPAEIEMGTNPNNPLNWNGYQIVIRCTKIGEFLWWKNGNKAKITISS